MRHYLYRHVRPDTNEVFYVGIGTKGQKIRNTFQDEYKRAFKKHSRNTYWKNVFNKCDGNYEVEILLESNDYDWIEQKEIEFVALYGRADLGLGTLVNLTDGGDGNRRMKMPEEAKRKISEANKGRPHTKEQTEKIRQALLGQKRTPEQRAAVSRAARNRCTVKPVLQFDLDGNFIREWPSVLIAAEGLNINVRYRSKIYRCCNGHQAHSAGYVWKWKLNEN